MSLPNLRVRLIASTARSGGSSRGRLTSSWIPSKPQRPSRGSSLPTDGSNPISIPVPAARFWSFSTNPGSGTVTRMWDRGCQTSKGKLEPTLSKESYSRTKRAQRTCQGATPKDSEVAVTSRISSSQDSGSFSLQKLSLRAHVSILAKGCRRRRWRSHFFWTLENSGFASMAWNRSSTSRVYLSNVPADARSTSVHLTTYTLFPV